MEGRKASNGQSVHAHTGIRNEISDEIKAQEFLPSLACQKQRLIKRPPFLSPISRAGG